jgi:hypothetical protein
MHISVLCCHMPRILCVSSRALCSAIALRLPIEQPLMRSSSSTKGSGRGTHPGDSGGAAFPDVAAYGQQFAVVLNGKTQVPVTENVLV